MLNAPKSMSTSKEGGESRSRAFTARIAPHTWGTLERPSSTPMAPQLAQSKRTSTRIPAIRRLPMPASDMSGCRRRSSRASSAPDQSPEASPAMMNTEEDPTAGRSITVPTLAAAG
jgi:hypothetical protein